MKKILFICTGNSCRSQMAEGFARTLKWDSYSAGVNPSPQINPNSIKVMQEIGINISHQTPEHIDKFLNMDFDLVVTVCDHAHETCPVFTGNNKQIIHQGFEDPDNAIGNDTEILGVYRRVRDEIMNWLTIILKKEY